MIFMKDLVCRTTYLDLQEQKLPNARNVLVEFFSSVDTARPLEASLLQSKKMYMIDDE